MKALFNVPEAATDTMGALEQRQKKYQDSEKEAKEQSNSSKARRMGRIVKVSRELSLSAFYVGLFGVHAFSYFSVTRLA